MQRGRRLAGPRRPAVGPTAGSLNGWLAKLLGLSGSLGRRWRAKLARCPLFGCRHDSTRLGLGQPPREAKTGAGLAATWLQAGSCCCSCCCCCHQRRCLRASNGVSRARLTQSCRHSRAARMALSRPAGCRQTERKGPRWLASLALPSSERASKQTSQVSVIGNAKLVLVQLRHRPRPPLAAPSRCPPIAPSGGAQKAAPSPASVGSAHTGGRVFRLALRHFAISADAL